MSRTINKKNTLKFRKKALKGNYRRCTVKDVHPHIKFVMTKDDHSWYFVMGATPCADQKNSIADDAKGVFAGDDDEFLRGQYIGKIVATKQYPYGPPDVTMLTPNGVFPLNNNNFCIDIGKYHANDYPATLGIDGYVKMIWSGIIGWKTLGHGINLIAERSSKAEAIKNIKKEAVRSVAYNKKHNAKILKMFTDKYN